MKGYSLIKYFYCPIFEKIMNSFNYLTKYERMHLDVFTTKEILFPTHYKIEEFYKDNTQISTKFIKKIAKNKLVKVNIGEEYV